MYERSRVNVKVEPHSTSRLSSTLNLYLASISFTRVKPVYVRVHARKNYATVEIHPKAGVRKAGFDCNVKRALRKET